MTFIAVHSRSKSGYPSLREPFHLNQKFRHLHRMYFSRVYNIIRIPKYEHYYKSTPLLYQVPYHTMPVLHEVSLSMVTFSACRRANPCLYVLNS